VTTKLSQEVETFMARLLHPDCLEARNKVVIGAWDDVAAQVDAAVEVLDAIDDAIVQ
jgi:hypothetical protein